MYYKFPKRTILNINSLVFLFNLSNFTKASSDECSPSFPFVNISYNCNTGATGPTGLNGNDGNTGPTGATGATGTLANSYVSLTVPTVPVQALNNAYAPTAFATEPWLSLSLPTADIIYNSTTNQFTLNTSGVYLISYNFYVNVTNATPVMFNLRVNGNQVTSANGIQNIIPGITANFSSSVVVNINSGDLVDISNSVVNGGITGTIDFGTISIARIA